MKKEIWKQIDGFDGRYSISSYGRVRSEEYVDSNGHCHKQFIRKASIGTNGYYGVVISLNGKSIRREIHRLVAVAFVQNPNNHNVVNHKDENKLNNRADNLEWCTQKYNQNYSYIPEDHHIPILQFSMNGEFIKEWESVSHVSKAFGKKVCHITSCCRGKLHSCMGYIWRYKDKSYFDRSDNLVGAKGHQFKKPVIQMDLNGNTIKRYECAKDAETETGVNNSKISMCCNGKRKSSGGFRWKFDTENNDTIIK